MSDSLEISDSPAFSAEPVGRTQLECRECGAICELVVTPWRCLRGQRSCVYAFADGESVYFGCLHKVFSAELDLAAFPGQKSREAAKGDPYGAVRVSRKPRPQCPIGVERAYYLSAQVHTCVNGAFLKEVFRAHGDHEQA